MRLDLDRKPEGVWASFNEYCGTGDGKTKEYLTPIPADQARSVLVMRDFNMLSPENRIVVTNEKTGELLKDEPDGYRFETRGENELWIVLDQPLGREVHLSVSGLGRQVGDSFKVLPASTFLQQKIREKQPAIFRGPVKDRGNATEQDLQDAGRVNFEHFVVDWCGITGENGPLPCDEKSKKLFLDRKDAQFFGLFVTNRASAIRAEQIRSHEDDSKN